MPTLLGGDALSQATLDDVHTARSEAQTAATAAEDSSSDADDHAQDALTRAQAAQGYAGDAETWAEGTDGEVLALGGTHSSEGWSDVARRWAEGPDVALLPGGEPDSQSAKAWASDAEGFAGDAEGFAGDAEGHAADAAGEAARSPGSTYAQRVLGVKGIQMYDLILSSASEATYVNCSIDGSGDYVRVIEDGPGYTDDPWSFELLIDGAADPGGNPLFSPDKLSYRLTDLGGTLQGEATGGGGPLPPATVTIELLNSSLVVVATPELGRFTGAAEELILDASEIDPGAARYIRLTIAAEAGQGGARAGDFPVGQFAAAAFQRTGYVDYDLGDTRYRRRERIAVDRALPYTLGADDDGLYVSKLVGSGALTLPQSSAHARRAYRVLNDTGAGVEVIAEGGVTLHSASGTTLAAGGTLLVTCEDGNDYWLTGDLS